MAAYERITAQIARANLHYDHETGLFIWLTQAARKITVGDVAGTRQKQGYISITLMNVRQFAHRWAWLWMTGEWPLAIIDHRNGVRDDNRWGNLRLADKSLNAANSVAQRTNPTGVKGVHLDGKGYRARLKLHGREIYLGHFDTIEEAAEAYALSHRQHFGEFSRTD